MAEHRHKRDTNARFSFQPKAALVAAPIALLLTAPAVALGVISADVPVPTDLTAAGGTSQSLAQVATQASLRGIVPAVGEREEFVSRSAQRTTVRRGTGGTGATGGSATAASSAKQKRAAAQRKRMAELKEASRKAVANAEVKRWTTTELNLWTGPGDLAEGTGVLDAGEHILVTGRQDAGRVEIVVGDRARWVTEGYLSAEKPEQEPTLGGVCTNGTTAGGANANVQKVHEAVCANFPTITTYGTIRGGGGDHPLGRAVDIMVSGDLGWEIAEFVRANAGALGVSYVIYAQRIWSVQRGGEGWRAMSNRGSATANHYDHVHVSTY